MEKVFEDHNRTFEKTKFIYPVISRRSRGLSLGINLDYDKICNFACPYCQVDRTTFPEDKFDFNLMKEELIFALNYLKTKQIFSLKRFAITPKELQVFRDVAIAGDGEPSVNPYLLDTVKLLNELKDLVPKAVLISNATGLNRPKTKAALEILKELGGEVWAKLDAGSQEYFEIVSGSKHSVSGIEKRIISIPKGLNLRIQTCLMKVAGVSPSEAEIKALKERILRINNAHELKEVQVYTIARVPAQSFVSPIKKSELEKIVKPLLDAQLPVKIYAGSAD